MLDNIVKKAVKKITFIFDCYDLAIYKESMVEILSATQ